MAMTYTDHIYMKTKTMQKTHKTQKDQRRVFQTNRSKMLPCIKQNNDHKRIRKI